MENKQKFGLKKLIAYAELVAMGYMSIQQHEGLEINFGPDQSQLKVEDGKRNEAITAYALTRTENDLGQMVIDIRRKTDGMKLGAITVDKELEDEYESIQTLEEFAHNHDLITQRLALIGGVAYREIFDEKTGKPTRFEAIDNENRKLFTKIEGSDDIIDFTNTLSQNNLVVTGQSKSESGILYRTFDQDSCTWKEGTGKEIIADLYQKMGASKSSTKDMVTKAKGEETEEILLGNGESLTHIMYDKDTLKGCIKVGNDYIVEDPSYIKELDPDQCREEIYAEVSEIKSSDSDRLQTFALEFLSDDSISKEDMAKYYDYLLQSKGNKKFRERYFKKMDRDAHAKVGKILRKVEREYSQEELEAMTPEDVVFKLAAIAQTKEVYMDSDETLTTKQKEREMARIVEIYDIIKDVKLNELYRNTRVSQNDYEAIKEYEKQEKQKLEKQESKVLKGLGFDEQVTVTLSHTEGERNHIIDGQEAIMFSDDGSMSIVTERVSDKRSYTKQTAESISMEDFYSEESDEIVSSDDMDFVQNDIFTMYGVDRDGNSREEASEMESSDGDLDI